MSSQIKLFVCLVLFAAAPLARAAERVTLANGFEFLCSHREISGDRVRLYPLAASGTQGPSGNYIEVAAATIASVEVIPELPAPATPPAPASASTPDLHQLLASAGARHNIDADLLAAVVQAESGGHTHAVSRTGARGLMQLMPGTAAQLGVKDSFAPEQNVGGGTTYLDLLLTRYHDDVTLALAAYNAGPAAVDRYHGVPPYAETRAYVARIVREFNRRKLAIRAASPSISSLASAVQ